MTRILPALLLLGLAGCAGPLPTDYTVTVDPTGFLVDQLDQISAGLTSWSVADPRINVRVVLAPCFGVGVPGPGRVCVVATCDFLASKAGYTIRTAGDRGANIGLCLARISQGHLTAVAAHEMGHAMGLEHVGDGLMFWQWHDVATPQAADVAQFWGMR